MVGAEGFNAQMLRSRSRRELFDFVEVVARVGIAQDEENMLIKS